MASASTSASPPPPHGSSGTLCGAANGGEGAANQKIRARASPQVALFLAGEEPDAVAGAAPP